VAAKSKMPDQVILLIKKLRSEQRFRIKHIVKTVRCDDAGENKLLEQKCIHHQLGIHFEYTGPGTPQYNGRVERMFASLYGRVRTMLNAAQLVKFICEGVWAEAAKRATDIENMLVTPNKPVAVYHRFYGIKEREIKFYKPFGDMAIVEENQHQKIRSKLVNRGRVCMFLGHAPNHATDTFRFLNLQTLNEIVSRDVIWLNKCYGDWKGLEKNNITMAPEIYDDSDTEVEYVDSVTPNPGRVLEVDEGNDSIGVAPNPEPSDPSEDDEDIFGDEAPTDEDGGASGLRIPTAWDADEMEVGNQRLQREMLKLSGFNPWANSFLTRTDRTNRQDRDRIQHQVRPVSDVITAVDMEMVSRLEPTVESSVGTAPSSEPRLEPDLVTVETIDTALTGIDYDKIDPKKYRKMFKVPGSYKEAVNHPCEWQRKRWIEAMSKENTKMESCNVCTLIDRSSMQPGRVCIKFRWVFEIKRDGTFRARLVACGYSQKPGVDFQKSYSPVINDPVLRIVVIYQMVKRLIAVFLDVEVAFLHGELKEIIYMECPDGVAYTGDKVVVLNKSMYGLVQAARQFS
jgi:Reverse transcriptase (RNA-dependent DNA polymerase)